jgi:hypothetical protein
LRVTVTIVTIGILLIGLTIVGAVPPTRADAPVSLAPAAISLSSIPPKLPANSITYPAIVVSVVDKVGHPTVALADVQVALTSSQENVGKVSDTVDIPAGATYAIANFTTTNTAGSTIITATSVGLATTSVAVTTIIAVGYPTHLVLTAVPNTVPARTANTGKLIMELQDDVGLPAKAIADVSISLFSSNTHVVNVTSPSFTMRQGEYLAEVDYSSGFVPGSALITASASAFDSGLATVTVLGFPALALKLFAQPKEMVTCTNLVTSCAGRLVVALTDLSGNPTKAPRDITVQIRTSNAAIVVANDTAVIKAGDLSAVSSYTTTALPGIARITASSPGLTSDFADVTTASPGVATGPSYCTNVKSGQQTNCDLLIFTGPNPVLADHQSYSSVVVAMTNGTSFPLINSTGPTKVTLTSSVTGVGNFTSITFNIPQGTNWASITFTSTFQVGATQLTASSQDFISTQFGLSTFGPVPSQVVLKAISPTLPADGGTHAALELDLEDSQGAPAIAPFSVPVSISSSHSSIVNVASAIIPAGQSFTVVNVTAGILEGKANVTALVSAFTTGYTTSWTILSTVIPAPSSLSAFAPDGNRIIAASATQLQLVAIQLEGGASTPARARAPMNISITSSNSTVLPKVLTVDVAVGQDYVQLNITPVVPGSTILTISTPGLAVATMPITFLPYPLVETISGGPPKIFTNQTAIISVNTMLDGAPLQGTPVHWKASSGGLIVATPPSTNSSITTSVLASASTSTRSTSTASPTGLPTVDDKTDKTGSSSMIFKPSKPGSALITAVVTPANQPSKTFNFTVQVTAVPTGAGGSKGSPSLIDQLTSFPYILAPIGGAGGAGAAVFFFLRRRGKGGAATDEEFDNAMG